jgi:sigma-B regulation protein RsbU (phosphoserine phosphatase)
MRVPIRTKLIIAILLPVLVVYLGVLAIHYQVGERQAVARAQQHLTQLASNHASRLDAIFLAARQAAVSTAGAASDQDRTPEPRWLDLVLTRNVRKVPHVYSSCVALEPNAFPDSPNRTARLAHYVLPSPPRAKVDKPLPPRPRAERPPPPGAALKPPPPPPGGPSLKPRPMPDPAPELPIATVDLARTVPKFFEAGWYHAAADCSTPYWMAPHAEPAAAGAYVTRCVAPMHRSSDANGPGKFIGAAAVDLFVAPLQKYTAMAEIEGGYGVLLDADGLVIAHPREALAMRQSLAGLFEQHALPELLDLAIAVRAGRSGVTRITDFHTGRPSWVVQSPLRSSGWSFMAVIPSERIMEPVYDALRRDMVLMLAGLAIIAGVVLVASIRLSRPIERVAAMARRVATGDLNASVQGIKRRDEIGDLATAFNRMVADLRKHVDALTRESAARKAVESELRVARQIQAALLPHVFPPFPHRPEFDLHGTNVPAKEVAGDFFDYFFVDDETLALVIGDVSGKGVPAALFMAVARTVLRNQALTGALPAEVLTRSNRLLVAENSGEMFVTIFLAHYNTRTGRVVYANAGHNPPCVASNGSVTALAGSTGPMLGIFPARTFQQRETQMNAGDTFVMYTDGVTEALDEGDRQFAMGRLQTIVRENRGATAEELCGLVVQAVERHSGDCRQDDITLLVLNRRT